MKVALGGLLIAAADALFFVHRPGATLGFFALSWLGAAALFRKGWIRDRRGLAAAGAATALALVMIDRPGFLTWVLFGLAPDGRDAVGAGSSRRGGLALVPEAGRSCCCGACRAVD